MGGQTGQALATRPPDPEEEGVAQGLTEDPADSANVTDSVKEEDELHLSRVDLVVVVQIFHKDVMQLYI